MSDFSARQQLQLFENLTIMGKTYLVTGGGGNLGSRLVDIICEKNIDNVVRIKLLDITFSTETRRQQANVCRGKSLNIYF